MNKTSFETVNPVSGLALQSYQYLSNEQLLEAIRKSWQAYTKFKNKSLSVKIEQLKKLAQGLRAHQKPLALLMTQEMGKAIVDSETEIEKCAVTADYFAENLAQFLADEEIAAQYPKSFVS